MYLHDGLHTKAFSQTSTIVAILLKTHQFRVEHQAKTRKLLKQKPFIATTINEPFGFIFNFTTSSAFFYSKRSIVFKWLKTD